MIDDHYQPSPMSHNPNHVCRGIYQWLGASHMTTTTTQQTNSIVFIEQGGGLIIIIMVAHMERERKLDGWRKKGWVLLVARPSSQSLSMFDLLPCCCSTATITTTTTTTTTHLAMSMSQSHHLYHHNPSVCPSHIKHQ